LPTPPALALEFGSSAWLPTLGGGFTVGLKLTQPRIIGRSSSHFTRVVRIFAVELGVDCSFQVVPNLMSTDAADYGGNPALRLPTLQTADGVWFGALNACRELARRARIEARVIWPEHLEHALAANAQELVVQAMATEVALIMSDLAVRGEVTDHQSKMRRSLLDSLAWLESHAGQALLLLPAGRDLSYLEVTLFCLVTHLEFRQVVPVAVYPELSAFCETFARRASAEATSYRFDA